MSLGDLMNRDRIFRAAAGCCLAALACGGAYGQQKKITVIKSKTKAAAPAAIDTSSEPDKVLYDRAITDLKHKRYIEERLSLETLINTYPDSEYLAKAKLAVADSYYAEGGVSNMTQAIGEYKSYIVFFPFDDNAAYAQMQIGQAHLKMMEKSDRDTSEALSAEGELQTFLLKYPDSKYAPQASQRLRDVQEVIADGQFKVATFYYLRPDYRASAARLVDLTQRYPLYSKSDEALWMLGDIYGIMKRKGSRNEDDRNHWSDLQGKVYDQIITNYPLSPRAAQAKTELKAMGMDVPESDPAALARMQKQQAFVKAHHQNTVMHAPMALMKTGPDFSFAAQSGRPNLDPPENSISAKDILNPTTTGPQFNLSASPAGGSSDSLRGGASDPISTAGDPPSDSTASAAPGSNDPVGQVNAPTTTSTPAADPTTVTTQGTSTDPAPAGADAATTPAQPAAVPPVGKNESTSKKKKGMGKLNPF
jgi:outer membrane protein assembly factor BamD